MEISYLFFVSDKSEWVATISQEAAGGRIFRRRCHFAKQLHDGGPLTALQGRSAYS